MRINTHNSFLISSFFHLMFLALFMLLPKPDNYRFDLSLNLDFTEGYQQIKREEVAKPSVNKTVNSQSNLTEAKPKKLHKTSDIKTQRKDTSPVISTVLAHYQQHNDAQSNDISTNKFASIALQSEAEGGKYTMQTEGIQKEGSEGDASQILSYLTDRIEAIKKYPYLARRKGIEGDVVLLIDIDKSGNLVNAKISKSSGYDILDQSAETLIKKVFPIKHNLNRDFKLTIPITYKLMR